MTTLRGMIMVSFVPFCFANSPSSNHLVFKMQALASAEMLNNQVYRIIFGGGFYMIHVTWQYNGMFILDFLILDSFDYFLWHPREKIQQAL